MFFVLIILSFIRNPLPLDDSGLHWNLRCCKVIYFMFFWNQPAVEKKCVPHLFSQYSVQGCKNCIIFNYGWLFNYCPPMHGLLCLFTVKRRKYGVLKRDTQQIQIAWLLANYMKSSMFWSFWFVDKCTLWITFSWFPTWCTEFLFIYI